MSNHSVKFHKDLISSFWVILLTDRQTDRHRWKHNVSGRHKYVQNIQYETSALTICLALHKWHIIYEQEWVNDKDEHTVLALRSLMCSSSTVSRFFSRNPSIWYSTLSAKCTMMYDVCDSRGFSKCFDLPACMSHTLWHQLRSDALGICWNNEKLTLQKLSHASFRYSVIFYHHQHHYHPHMCHFPCPN